MKNYLLLFVTFMLVGFSVQATTVNTNHSKTIITYNDYGETFTFVERGITFAVFQNGEFDFYINQRNGFNLNYSARNTAISFNSGYNYDAYVQYDDYGAVIQVENVPIYYDYYGRVSSIGSININYNYGRLVSVGGLFVNYDTYGNYSHYSGYINTYNRRYVYHPYHNYFSRPLFDFRIVSHKPYRNYYRPNRYKYNRDYSRNKYYSNYNKRNSHNTRKRFATRDIPKRKSDKIVNYDRSKSRLNNINRSQIKNYSAVNTSKRRNKTATKSTRNSRFVKGRTKTIAKRSQERKTQEKRSITNRKSVNSHKNNKAIKTRKPVTSKKSKKVATKTRKPAKRDKSKSDSSKKRRG